MKEYDVVIAGGGPAGSAAAIVLARAGRRVLLVDPTGEASFKVGEGLPAAASRLLRDLGVLDAFLADGHLPSYGNQSAWGGPELHTQDSLRDPDGHGWHLDRTRFDATLRRGARQAGAELIGDARVWTASHGPSSHSPSRWRLEVRLGSGVSTTVRGHFLVDATGRSARLARQLGAATSASGGMKDQLVAFSVLFTAAQPGSAQLGSAEPGSAEPTAASDQDTLTLVESEPDGWWYTARLPHQRRIVAFLTDFDLEAAGAVRRGRGFEARLEQTAHVRRRLEACDYHRLGEPRGGPACSACLDPLGGDGWLAVGDAALAFDPLSSQGILTALYSGHQGAKAIDAELSGQGRALSVHSRGLRDVYKAYLEHRAMFYAQETRWKNHTFWRRRWHQRSPIP